MSALKINMFAFSNPFLNNKFSKTNVKINSRRKYSSNKRKQRFKNIPFYLHFFAFLFFLCIFFV